MKTKGCVFEQHRYWGPPGAVGPPVVTTPDDSRFGNHGANTAITYEQQPSGLFASVFNGATSRINCGAGASLNLTSDLSIILWLWVASLGVTADFLVHRFAPGGGNEGYTFALSDTVAGAIRFYSNNGGWDNSTGLITAGLWNFAAVTLSNITGTFYINDKPAETFVTGRPASNPGDNLDIGNQNGGGLGSLANLHSFQSTTTPSP